MYGQKHKQSDHYHEVDEVFDLNQIPMHGSEPPPTPDGLMTKTKMCIFFGAGKCTKGSKCTFAHDEIELRSFHDLSRTKICPLVKQGQKCRNSSCRFAHKNSELRVVDTDVETEVVAPDAFTAYDMLRGGVCRAERQMPLPHPVHTLQTEPTYYRNQPVRHAVYPEDSSCFQPTKVPSRRQQQIRRPSDSTYEPEGDWFLEHDSWSRNTSLRSSSGSGRSGVSNYSPGYPDMTPTSSSHSQGSYQATSGSDSGMSSGVQHPHATTRRNQPADVYSTKKAIGMCDGRHTPGSFPYDRSFVQFVASRIYAAWASPRNTSTCLTIWDPDIDGGLLVDWCDRFPTYIGCPPGSPIDRHWNFFQNGFSHIEEDNRQGMLSVMYGELEAHTCIQTCLHGAMQRCSMLLHMLNVTLPLQNGPTKRFVFIVQADVTDLFMGSKDAPQLEQIVSKMVHGTVDLCSLSGPISRSYQ